MASKGGNFFNELLDDPELEQSQKKPAQKSKIQEKQRQIAAAAAGKKQDKSKAASAPEKTKKHVAEIDTSRPQKRAFDRQSGTGRGKEVSKGGHLGAGKLIEPQVVQEATEEVVSGKKPEIKLPPADEQPKEQQKKEEPKKEEPKKPKTPQVVNQTLQQYTQKMDSMKIMLEQRHNAKPNEMESEITLKNFRLLNDARPQSQDLNATIPVAKPKAKPAPKPEPAKTEKKDAKKEEAKKAPKKEDAKKPAKKEEKKGGKKEEPKKEAAPAPVPKKKVEKQQERLTTADFFKGVQPVAEPRRRPERPAQRPPREERRERPERSAPSDAPTTLQRWTPSGGTETIVEQPRAAAPVEAAPQPRAPVETRQRAAPKSRFVSNEAAFPTLGKAPKAKKEVKAAEKPAATKSQ